MNRNSKILDPSQIASQLCEEESKKENDKDDESAFKYQRRIKR